MANPVRIFIADPNEEFSANLAKALAANADFTVVGTAADGEAQLITEPFSSNEAFVRLLARRLSIQQKPADLFWIQYLSGKIPGVSPPQTGEITREDDEEET